MRTSLLLLCALCTSALLQAESVDVILSRMDQSAPAFRGVSADIQLVTYTVIISDKTVENGTLKVQRQKSGATRAILDFSGQSDSREIAFLGNIVRMYYPNLKMYQDYDIGQNSDVLNQFLLLGFGSSGKELAQNYDVSGEGVENVAGQETTKLLLVPKSDKMKAHLAKIEMWISANGSYPVQQQFYEPSGNYKIATYSNIKLNPPIKGTLDLKLPSGVKKRSA
jgi:outer membrane lipoprotein-sorting protein